MVPSPHLSQASSVAPAEKSSTLSLPLTFRRPSGCRSNTAQTDTPSHLASLLEMLSPRGSPAPYGRRGLTLTLCRGRLLWAIVSTPRASRMTEDRPSFTPTRFAQSAPVHLHHPVDSDSSLACCTSQRCAHPGGFFHPLIHVIFVLSECSHTQVDTQQPGAVEGWWGVSDGGTTSIA